MKQENFEKIRKWATIQEGDLLFNLEYGTYFLVIEINFDPGCLTVLSLKSQKKFAFRISPDKNIFPWKRVSVMGNK